MEAPRLRLPSAPTALVGRRLELTAVEAILRRDDVRLVTLTGPGGTGKTRLALAVAEHLAPAVRGGAAFVDLSSIRDAELIVPTIGQAIGVAEVHEVESRLAASSVLLVLDNLEQLAPRLRRCWRVSLRTLRACVCLRPRACRCG